MSGRRGRNASRQKPILVHSNDVLNGRGVKIAQHPGNLRFRSLVKEMKDDRYCENFSSGEKKALAREIINHIQTKLNPPGRFLKRHGQEGPWEELTKQEIEKKTKQALRDCNRSDRDGYAARVSSQHDVKVAVQQRKASGLSLQEHARRKVEEESSRRSSRTRDGNYNRKTPPTSGVDSRSSRRANQVESRVASTADLISADDINARQMEQSMELSFHPTLDAPVTESSTSTWEAVPSTVNSTPAPRPYGQAAPVTQTPNPSNIPFFPTNGHHHSQPDLSGSQPMMNPHPSMFQENFADRHSYPDHQSSAARIHSSVSNFASPVLRTPAVAQPPTDSSSNIFEGHHETSLDEWPTEPRGQNLFPMDSIDPFESLTARAVEGLNTERLDADFMQPFGHVNGVSDSPNTNDNDGSIIL